MMLSGNVAAVTGGARGIGKEIALVLAQHGADICLIDMLKEDLDAAKKDIEKTGRRCETIICDISQADNAADAVNKIVDTLGKITILVNNAGITRDGLALRMSDQDWESVIKVNLNGAFYMSRAAVKFMVKQRAGSIVNIASIIGLIGNAGQANYAASKAGLIGLTKSFAKEVSSRSIRVNAVAPGFIATKMTEVLPEEVKNEMLKMIPMKRFGAASDVAKAVLFLCSDMAAYITGQVIVVDGGMVM